MPRQKRKTTDQAEFVAKLTKALKQVPLTSLIDSGIESYAGVISEFGFDEATGRQITQVQSHLDSIMRLAKDPSVPEDVGTAIYSHANEMDSMVYCIGTSACEATINGIVRFILANFKFGFQQK